MDFTTILIIILAILAVGAFPGWPHSRSWGYLPSATLGIVLILVLVWMLVRG